MAAYNFTINMPLKTNDGEFESMKTVPFDHFTSADGMAVVTILEMKSSTNATNRLILLSSPLTCHGSWYLVSDPRFDDMSPIDVLSTQFQLRIGGGGITSATFRKLSSHQGV